MAAPFFLSCLGARPSAACAPEGFEVLDMEVDVGEIDAGASPMLVCAEKKRSRKRPVTTKPPVGTSFFTWASGAALFVVVLVVVAASRGWFSVDEKPNQSVIFPQQDAIDQEAQGNKLTSPVDHDTSSSSSGTCQDTYISQTTQVITIPGTSQGTASPVGATCLNENVTPSGGRTTQSNAESPAFVTQGEPINNASWILTMDRTSLTATLDLLNAAPQAQHDMKVLGPVFTLLDCVPLPDQFQQYMNQKEDTELDPSFLDHFTMYLNFVNVRSCLFVFRLIALQVNKSWRNGHDGFDNMEVNGKEVFWRGWRRFRTDAPKNILKLLQN
eukprot:GHVO01014887.1.p1 GENE.GHVO01014887.1~~GHVO01014887.1.p1  ORF type:complete len:344 (+),score=45.41 GHVO01014887.1:49-1032(+)